jgi:hypothetical protein
MNLPACTATPFPATSAQAAPETAASDFGRFVGDRTDEDFHAALVFWACRGRNPIQSYCRFTVRAMGWTGGETEAPKRPEAASAPIPHPTDQPPGISQSANSIPRPIKDPRPKLDLEAEALAALEEARAMPSGPERTEAMKRVGILRNAADLQGMFFARRGRPPKD